VYRLLSVGEGDLLDLIPRFRWGKTLKIGCYSSSQFVCAESSLSVYPRLAVFSTYSALIIYKGVWIFSKLHPKLHSKNCDFYLLTSKKPDFHSG